MKKQHIFYLVATLLIVLIIRYIVIHNSTPSNTHSDITINTWDENRALSWEILSHDSNIEDIKKLQTQFWPEVVMELECDILTTQEDKKYCDREKQFYTDLFNQVTWWSVVAKWSNYIMWFDCSQIFLPSWQKECSIFQQTFRDS